MRRIDRSARREFLRLTGRGALGLGALAGLNSLGLVNALAAGGDYKALVCVFLYGGNDSNNTVVPLDATQFAAYTRARGVLALPATRLVSVGASGGRTFGFHEQLRDLAGLYTQGRLAVVANMGTLVRPTTRDEYRNGNVPLPDQLFAHDNQQAEMQSAYPAAASTGWGGRALDQLLDQNGNTGFPPALSMSGGSLFLVGNQAQFAGLGADNNLDLKALDVGNDQDRALRTAAHQDILQMASGLRLVQESNTVRLKAAELQQMLNSASGGPELTTVFPDSGLGQQLKEVTRFIQLRDAFGLGRQVFFCAMGGFDTHSDQDVSQAGLFEELNAALLAFYNATVEMSVADKVTTFTESDFSRTLNPSGNGTDHAWGSHHFVMGGAVHGNEMYGTFPVMQTSGPDDSGDRGAWIPKIAISQYGATLASWFGVPDGSLDLVFPTLPNFAQRNLGFV